MCCFVCGIDIVITREMLLIWPWTKKSTCKSLRSSVRELTPSRMPNKVILQIEGMKIIAWCDLWMEYLNALYFILSAQIFNWFRWGNPIVDCEQLDCNRAEVPARFTSDPWWFCNRYCESTLRLVPWSEEGCCNSRRRMRYPFKG